MEVTHIRRYKAGYEVRTELINGNEYGCADFFIKSAYTSDGQYIGDPKWAYRLAKRGISPEKSKPSNNVCSIGFSAQEQKWYGWSHRVIAGFGIGDEVDSPDQLCASSGWTKEYLLEHPEEDRHLPVGFIARTLEDAKRMAVAFAEAVS